MILLKHFLRLVSCLSLVVSASSHRPCNKLPPGTEQIFHGVDLPTLDLYWFKSDDDRLSGLREVLFSLSCDKNGSWTNGSVRYTVPDQVATFDDKPTQDVDVSPVLCHHLDCYRKMLSASQITLGTVVNAHLRGAFSSTDRFKAVQVEMLRHQKVFGEVSETVSG